MVAGFDELEAAVDTLLGGRSLVALEPVGCVHRDVEGHGAVPRSALPVATSVLPTTTPSR